MRNKLLSGRFWLTVISGFVFAYSTYSRILSKETVAVILVMIFKDYFQRSDRKKEVSDV